MTDAPRTLFAVSTPGLEEVTARELRDLRLRKVHAEPGGVTFQGTLADALRTNLWLRTASRVLLRVGEFRARHLSDVTPGAATVPWDRLLPTTVPVSVRVTCRKSRVRHSGAVAERVARAVADALGVPARPGGADRAEVGDGPVAPDDPRQEIRVRLHHDIASVSLDTTGGHLHRRGSRQETAKAPLRETLAASLIRLSGWRGDRPLVDPCCGAGTLVIEAALLAARRAPGAGRTFALEAWPELDPAVRATLDAEVQKRRRPVAVPLRGADRDAGAVAAARRNAARAGLEDAVVFEQAPLSALTLTTPAGLVVCNPPYGRRVGQPRTLKNLYATLGARIRQGAPGWQLALITGDPSLARATGLSLSPLAPPVPHGGLRVQMYAGKVDDHGAVVQS